MSRHQTAPTGFHVLLGIPRGIVNRIATGSARLTGAGLLIAIGLIHLVLAPQYYPAAAYVGISFYVTCVASWATALAIVVGVRGAWVVGGLISLGSLGALLAASTVGLPQFTDSLSAPWAMLSLTIETIFVGLYLLLAVVRRNLALAPRTGGRREAVATPPVTTPWGHSQ